MWACVQQSAAVVAVGRFFCLRTLTTATVCGRRLYMRQDWCAQFAGQQGLQHRTAISASCDLWCVVHRLQSPTGSEPDVWRQLPSALFQAAGFQMFRAFDDDEFHKGPDFMQSQIAAGMVIMRQLRERDQELQAAEEKNRQLQEQLLQAQQQRLQTAI